MFGISESEITSPDRIDLKKKYRGTLESFYRNNEANPTYFRSRAKENVVAHFMKNVFVNDPFLDQGRRVRDIVEYIRTNPSYQKDFNPKVIAKVLDRMARTGIQFPLYREVAYLICSKRKQLPAMFCLWSGGYGDSGLQDQKSM